MLSNSAALLPAASYERDPTIDYGVHKAILYTMASCHSLRTINEELLGDPLDIKMFEFTGWSLEELAQRTVSEESIHKSPASISRPPAGLDYGAEDSTNSMTVRIVGISETEFCSSSIEYPD